MILDQIVNGSGLQAPFYRLWATKLRETGLDLEGLCSGWNEWVADVVDAKNRVEVKWQTREEEIPFTFADSEETNKKPQLYDWDLYEQEDKEQIFAQSDRSETSGPEDDAY